MQPPQGKEPSADKAVDVLLAEFNALRAEMHSYISAQAALVGLGLTALGVITSLAVGNNGDDDLLLAIPPLVALIVLAHTAETYRIATLGDYIREKLWPDLERRVGNIPSWEIHAVEQRPKRAVTVFLKAIGVDFPAMTLFLLSSVIVLATAPGKWETLWCIGLVATVVAIAVPVIVGRQIQTRKSAQAFRAAGVPRECCPPGP